MLNIVFLTTGSMFLRSLETVNTIHYSLNTVQQAANSVERFCKCIITLHPIILEKIVNCVEITPQMRLQNENVIFA